MNIEMYVVFQCKWPFFRLNYCVFRGASIVEHHFWKKKSACVITSVLLCVIQLSAEKCVSLCKLSDILLKAQLSKCYSVVLLRHQSIYPVLWIASLPISLKLWRRACTHNVLEVTSWRSDPETVLNLHVHLSLILTLKHVPSGCYMSQAWKRHRCVYQSYLNSHLQWCIHLQKMKKQKKYLTLLPIDMCWCSVIRYTTVVKMHGCVFCMQLNKGP